MKPRLLFISGREVGYIRNRVLLNALREHFDIAIFTPPLSGIIPRIIVGLGNFLLTHKEYALCFVGFYGQPLAIVLSFLQKKPIILDAYVSTFDTLCEDRQLFHAQSLMGKLATWLDRYSCKVVSHVITDTQSDAEYFHKNFDVPVDKISPIYVGCDEGVFYPREISLDDESVFEIFYYGSFLPLHGTEVIIQAAALLKARPEIHFTLGGVGAKYDLIVDMVSAMGLENVDLIGWIPLERIPNYIARADVCLGGHFSIIPKAGRVISTKTFQFLAMRKPTIVGDNAATREFFTDGINVLAVPMGDSESLAEAIIRLSDDQVLRGRIAGGGYRVFTQRATTGVIAEQLLKIVEEMLCVSVS